ncbi:5-oxoprolinase subunit PxpB [Falsirhodobacter sp. alg1]|uniref:5-oxoprolinase subunit PxpB n=1 Tax=Falsirhodobacter sp. alg1 TaxID=1472418 RepID=UPI0005EFD21A|nr:5-oxoprolinase subunit PxpB [Falsirhodobacter sp. alg1]
MDDIRILPCGDQALSFQISDRIDPDVNARIIALAAALGAAAIAGVTEYVPTYRALLVRYDPEVLRGAELARHLRRLYASLQPDRAPARLWRIPVWYGGPAALDLADLAAEKGMTAEALAALHSASDFRVFMIGFAPGFAYLGGLPEALHTPRLEIPRQMVPAGAIGIGGQQASINSVAGPSGWRFIGSTPVRLFDPARNPAFLLTAGDAVRFTPVDAATYDRLTARAATGDPLVAPEVLS